jgi:hypothetical protein
MVMGFLPPVSSSDCIFSPGYGRWFTIRPPVHPIDNSVMHIRAAGSVFSVGKRSVHTSVSDLQTTSETEEDSNLNLRPEEDTVFQAIDILKADPCVAELNGNSEIQGADESIFKQNSPLDFVIPPPAEYATGANCTTFSGFTPIRKSKSAPLSRCSTTTTTINVSHRHGGKFGIVMLPAQKCSCYPACYDYQQNACSGVTILCMLTDRYYTSCVMAASQDGVMICCYLLCFKVH